MTCALPRNNPFSFWHYINSPMPGLPVPLLHIGFKRDSENQNIGFFGRYYRFHWEACYTFFLFEKSTLFPQINCAYVSQNNVPQSVLCIIKEPKSSIFFAL